jgi:hypothetical protein
MIPAAVGATWPKAWTCAFASQHFAPSVLKHWKDGPITSCRRFLERNVSNNFYLNQKVTHFSSAAAISKSSSVMVMWLFISEIASSEMSSPSSFSASASQTHNLPEIQTISTSIGRNACGYQAYCLHVDARVRAENRDFICVPGRSKGQQRLSWEGQDCPCSGEVARIYNRGRDFQAGVSDLLA